MPDPAPHAPPPLELVVYGKADCHLCDVAWEVLERERERLGLVLRKVDIASDEELLARYGEHVPVGVLAEREVFRHRVDPRRLEASCRARREELA